jgi:hypothetical protein
MSVGEEIIITSFTLYFEVKLCNINNTNNTKNTTKGTGSFPGIKRPGRGVDHPTHLSAEVKERVELHLYSPFGPSWPVIG